MAKNINPDFQAAPFLGQSSFDPIESVRRVGNTMTAIKKQKQEEEQAATLEGLQRLSTQVKGWADMRGFEEITSEESALKDEFIKLMRSGVNVANPKDSRDQIAFKTVEQALSRIRGKAMLYNENKRIFDDIEKRLGDPRLDELMDKDATKANLESALQTGDIYSMREMLNNAIVMKPQLGDIDKTIAKLRPGMIKLPEREEIVEDENGNKTVVRTQKWTPELRKQAIKDARRDYAGLKDPDIQSLQMQFDRLKEYDRLDPLEDGEKRIPDGWNLEDLFIAKAFPQYKEEFSERPTSKGGSFDINFIGGKANISPGKMRPEPMTIGGKTFMNFYQFKTPSRKIPVNTGSSRYTGGTEQPWENFEQDGYIEGELQFYDPITDSFLFRVTEDSDVPFARRNETVIVPHSLIGSDADELKVQDGNSIKQLKDIYKKVPAAAKKTTSVPKGFWGTSTSK